MCILGCRPPNSQRIFQHHEISANKSINGNYANENNNPNESAVVVWLPNMALYFKF